MSSVLNFFNFLPESMFIFISLNALNRNCMTIMTIDFGTKEGKMTVHVTPTEMSRVKGG